MRHVVDRAERRQPTGGDRSTALDDLRDMAVAIEELAGTVPRTT